MDSTGMVCPLLFPYSRRFHMRRALSFMCAFGMLASVANGQSADAQPLKIGDAVVSSSLRTRMYSWNWFGDTPNGDYTYSGSLLRFGLTESRKTLDWQVEFAVPALVDMPTTAVMPAPFGQLGLGGSYAAANSGATNSSSIFLKQGNVRIKGLGGIAGQSIKAGRMEFIDGSEVTPAHGTLAALKRDRIAQRLLANFGFSDVQRSLGWRAVRAQHAEAEHHGSGGPAHRGRVSGQRMGRIENQRLLRCAHRRARQVRRNRLARLCARLQRLSQRCGENGQPRGRA